MQLSPVLEAARSVLLSLTPLKSDCGRLCGRACCRKQSGRSDEAEGMLLFPGEEAIYEARKDFRLLDGALGKILVCTGSCARADRPLSCRVFPLLPILRDGKLHVVTDIRSRAVCPLSRTGKSALDPAFVQAVRTAGNRLAADEVQRSFLLRLGWEQNEWKQVKAAWEGKT